MPSFAPFVKVYKAIAATTDRDFERKILPYLQIFWPELVQPVPRKVWDRKGIDFFTWDEHKPFPCVVQCKGFEVKQLENKQIAQVRKSVSKFIDSNLRCRTYILIHNRDGKHTNFNSQCNELLSKIKSLGRAEEVHLLDLRTFFNQVFEHLKKVIDQKLLQHSSALLEHYQKLFDFGEYYVPIVPVIEKDLIFKKGTLTSIAEISQNNSRNVSELILLKAPTTVWTILCGLFGAGKTTTALHTAVSSARKTIFIQCAQLSASSQLNSTNMLLQEILTSLKILDEFDEDIREEVYKISGAALGNLLRKTESNYMLIFDGLDENRAFSNFRGFRQLTNQLIGFTCPVILTTRIEHLYPMFGDFTAAMDFPEFSWRLGSHKGAKILELSAWEKEQVLTLIQNILSDQKTKEKTKTIFTSLYKLVESDKYMEYYGNILFNPLFFQMILEDIADMGIRKSDRVMLLNRWIERKIRRDMGIPTRVTLNDSMDRNELVERVFWLMERLAFLMTSKNNGEYELLENIASAQVIELGQNIFGNSINTLLSILLNSVLVPTSYRMGINLNVAFSFKILQEYFLASHLIRNNISIADYPSNVCDLYEEIKVSIQE